MVSIRPVEERDVGTWLKMRIALWPDGSETEHREEIAQFFRGDFPRFPWAVFVAESDDEGVIGFSEVSIRPYAEGCLSYRVAYLEGWFVRPDARRQGIGRALVEAAKEWGRSHGCCEFASDTEADNQVSAAAHLSLGFTDAGLVRCFRMDL